MSGFLNWLSQAAPADDSPTPPPPTTTARPNVPTPSTSEPDDDLAELSEDNPSLMLDEVYTTIDYTDAHGNETRRRITMRNLSLGAHGTILSAICHERKRFRQFRVDRIECFIDDDGVVTETVSFFADILGVQLPPAPENETAAGPSTAGLTPDFVRHWPAKSQIQLLQDRLRPALALLVAASRSDRMRDVEVDAIMTYIENEAFADSPQGRFTDITFDDIAKLEPTIRRMRPRRASIPNHLKSLEDLGEAHIERFNRALRCVLFADGKLSPEEVEFYSLIDEWLSGHSR